MYRRVGADYQWVDRLPWSDARWAEYAARVETHLVELAGRTAGYYEIELDSADSSKIALFGLLAEFHGIGLGGHALTAALTRARELRPRVWLTTCTLDGPYALANYRARGMRAFRTATVPTPRRSAPLPAGESQAGVRHGVVKSEGCKKNRSPGARPSCPTTSWTSPGRRRSPRAPS